MHISQYIYICNYTYCHIYKIVKFYLHIFCNILDSSPCKFSDDPRSDLVAGEMLPFDPRQVGGLFLQPPSYVWWFLNPTHMLHV